MKAVRLLQCLAVLLNLVIFVNLLHRLWAPKPVQSFTRNLTEPKTLTEIEQSTSAAFGTKTVGADGYYSVPLQFIEFETFLFSLDGKPTTLLREQFAISIYDISPVLCICVFVKT